MAKTTQKLAEETLERIKKRGSMGDSFDRVLNRLLDEIEDLERPSVEDLEEVDEDDQDED